jgi:small subunit ribosomal protein S16
MVIVDSRKPRDGAFVEIIGNYNPRTEPASITIKEERALYWLKQGAQPTVTTARLLGKAGIMDKFKPVKEKS